MKIVGKLVMLKLLTIMAVYLILPKWLVLANGEYQENEYRQKNYINRTDTFINGANDNVQRPEEQGQSYRNDKMRVGGYAFLKNKWRFTFQYGLLQSRMNEYVYNVESSELLSKLIWRNTAVSILTGGVAYRPVDLFEIELKGSITPTKGSGRWRMDDYDWVDGYDKPFTDHSFHTEGEFTYINLDLTTKLRLFELGKIDDNGIFSLWTLLGISYTELSSLQDGMSYVWYNRGAYVREENDENGLLYRQRLVTPYLGLSAIYQYKRFSILMEFKYSFLNVAKTLDIHYNRDYYTYDNYHNIPVYALRINTGYWITNHIRAFFEASFAETKTKSVYSIMVTIPDEEHTYYQDGYIVYHGRSGEGMNNWRYIFSLGINVGF